MDERLNAFARLCNLPAEILGRILKLSQRPEAAGPGAAVDDCAWTTLDYSWLSLAVTCSYLWSIAVQERELWSWIEYTDEWANDDEWTAHTVARAGHVPLRMRAVQIEEADTIIEWAVRYLPRAQAALIGLHGSTRHEVLPLVEALRQPAPLLQTLAYSNFFKNGEPVLDHRFLGGSSHTLRKLVLARVEIGDTMPALPALRDLHLSVPWGVRDCGGLRALLAQAPALESIRFEGIQASGVTASEAAVAVRMPNLASLCITNTQARTTATILALLPMPARELVVHCPRDDDSLASVAHARIFARCREFWAMHRPSAPMLPGGALTITTVDSGCVHNEAWALEYASETAAPRLSYRVASVSRQDTMLADVHSLKVVRASWFMPDPTHLPALRTLAFEEWEDDPRSVQILETWVWARVQAADIQSISFVRCPMVFQRISEQLMEFVPRVTFSVK